MAHQGHVSLVPQSHTLKTVWQMDSVKQMEQPAFPLYDLDTLAPGVANPLGVWARFKSWLNKWRDLLALCCILIFVCHFVADLCTVVALAVKAGPTAAITVWLHIYDYHRQLYKTSVKQHLSANISTEDSCGGRPS